MNVRWTRIALADLRAVYTTIAEEQPGAAERTVDRIGLAIEHLERHPELGRKGRVAGTRELIVGTYIIVYRIRRKAINLVSIIHTSRRWPNAFPP